MANAAVVANDPPPPLTEDFDFGLCVPPLDIGFLSQQFIDDDGAIADNHDDAVMDDFDFDISFDDLYLPSAEELDALLNPTLLPESGFQSEFARNSQEFDAVFKSTSSELRNDYDDQESSGDQFSGVLNSVSSGMESQQVSNYLNVPSPESKRSNRGTSGNCGGEVNVSYCHSPDSRGLDNCDSDVSTESNPILDNRLTRDDGVNEEIKLQELPKNNPSSSLLKRKKDNEDLPNKHRKSNHSNSEVSEEEEKTNARLARNRESAQLSRRRKQIYVDELVEKVKIMQSTIHELNAKVSYFMAENITLRQQIGGAVPPPPVAVPLPGMFVPPVMMYPWMPPYLVKPQGSQVPLVPIPRLKPQKKLKTKTKKVAGICFLGLLFFIVLFEGLAPMVNMRYGRVRETVTGGVSYVGDGFYEKHQGKALMINGSVADGTVQLCNESEPLVASLYVPRNDKLVKIDGNLIISSVLASEKAILSHKNGGDENETGLAVPGGLVPINGARFPQLPSLGSSSVDMDVNDDGIQQWFLEGLSGPMFSSGMCTEVFRFDTSPSSASEAIFPATASRNIFEKQNQNSTYLSKGRNRRILGGLPIPHNISQKENSKGNSSTSPMVVSVLVYPREMGNADVDGVMGKKSLSKIFVVVLIDSVKYVTYSCMLPFKGSGLHLVAARG